MMSGPAFHRKGLEGENLETSLKVEREWVDMFRLENKPGEEVFKFSEDTMGER